MKLATILAMLAITAIVILARYQFGDPQAVWVASLFGVSQ